MRYGDCEICDAWDCVYYADPAAYFVVTQWFCLSCWRQFRNRLPGMMS